MGTSLPIYVNTAPVNVVALAGAEPATGTQITDLNGVGCGGSLIRGVQGVLATTGGAVTISIYDGATVATSRQYYSVVLTYAGALTQLSDTQEPGIPALGIGLFVTIFGDAAAAGKTFSLLPYLQKLSIGS